MLDMRKIQMPTDTKKQTLVLSDIPFELRMLIAEFLLLRDKLRLALVHKDFHDYVMTNSFWNCYLKKKYQVGDDSQPNLACETFKNNLKARNSYFFLYREGRRYFDKCYKSYIVIKDLDEAQLNYLNSKKSELIDSKDLTLFKSIIKKNKKNSTSTTTGCFDSKHNHAMSGQNQDETLSSDEEIAIFSFPLSKRRI